ncbi:MAG: hypothetical protein ACRCZO_14020 [Cetobacterium sp.]
MDRQVTIESIKLVEQLKKIFPNDGYHLISMQEKSYIWEKNMDISKEKPIKEIDSGIKTRDFLNSSEIKFFDSLYGNIKPETLINFNLNSKLIENKGTEDTKTLILGEDFVNEENKRVLKFTFLNFRELDLNELKDKNLSEKEFINSLIDSFHPDEVKEVVENKNSNYILFETEKFVIPAIIILITSIIYIV